MKTVFSTLIGFLAMECQGLLIGLRHGQGLAKHTFGPHKCPRCSPNGQKWQNFNTKNQLKIKKKLEIFFGFFGLTIA